MMTTVIAELFRNDLENRTVTLPKITKDEVSIPNPTPSALASTISIRGSLSNYYNPRKAAVEALKHVEALLFTDTINSQICGNPLAQYQSYELLKSVQQITEKLRQTEEKEKPSQTTKRPAEIE